MLAQPIMVSNWLRTKVSQRPHNAMITPHGDGLDAHSYAELHHPGA